MHMVIENIQVSFVYSIDMYQIVLMLVEILTMLRKRTQDFDAF